MLNHHDFKIIDFISSIKNCDNYIDKEIVLSFLERNSITKDLNDSVMYFAIHGTIEQNEIKSNKIDEIKKKINKKNYILGKKL